MLELERSMNLVHRRVHKCNSASSLRSGGEGSALGVARSAPAGVDEEYHEEVIGASNLQIDWQSSSALKGNPEPHRSPHCRPWILLLYPSASNSHLVLADHCRLISSMSSTTSNSSSSSVMSLPSTDNGLSGNSVSNTSSDKGTETATSSTTSPLNDKS